MKIGAKSRNLKGQGLSEGLSTRMLIHASMLIKAGLEFKVASEAALVNPLTDDQDIREALRTTVEVHS